MNGTLVLEHLAGKRSAEVVDAGRKSAWRNAAVIS
jgi:hypothetical protein